MIKDTQRAILRACARFIGKKIEPVEVRLTSVEKATASLVTKDDVDTIRQSLEKRVVDVEQVKALQGPKGEPGQDAEPVLVADVVKELLATDALAPILDLMVADAVAKHFEANPVKHGKDGEPGPKGDPGDPGTKGDPGADGVGIAGALINRDSQLVITTTKGDAVNLGVVVGKDGAAGRDGADGLGFDDADIAYDGERGFTIKWQQGDHVKERTFHVPTVIDRGYWREGTEAKTGDAMTHDGTLWIALRDTKAKPSRESGDWRIGARKGRDGLQGPPGKEYKPPEPVSLK